MNIKATPLFLLFTILILAGCSNGQIKQEVIQEVIFVILNEKGEFKEVKNVPLIVGQSYGWILKSKHKNIVKWKEVFTLPSKPKVWGYKEALSNVNVIKKSESAIKSNVFGEEYYGYITNIWSVAEGDPAGVYNFKIYYNNYFVKEFNIEFYEQKL